MQIPFDVIVYLRGMSLFRHRNICTKAFQVFALYNYNTAIGILAMTVVIADTTGALLLAITLYRQAEFGSFCSTTQGKLGLIVPYVL